MFEHERDPLAVVELVEQRGRRRAVRQAMRDLGLAAHHLPGESGFCAGDTALMKTRRPSARPQIDASDGP